ncbi:YnbE family lipoprotein [Enterobacter sp.]|uniref:YnbE family lipoprotein n=1 Tax=Enterobacter sp. TaxID=42895 RepID=UPI00296EF6A2|nr:YnbE family lipoprotein [Enterobacter sp.]
MKSVITIMLIIGLSGCTPRIEVAAPKEPITINMNVKIEHDIHIKADKEIETLLHTDGESR